MKTRLFVLVLALGVFFAWFWPQPTSEPETQEVQPESLANPPDSFFETKYILQPSTGFTLVEGTTLELAFSDDDDAIIDPESAEDVIGVWFHAGCNRFNGDFRLTSSGLESADWAMLTEMGCERALHEQEDWLVTFLMDEPRLSLSGDVLTLTGKDATLSFLNKKVADPDRPLVGSAWTAAWYFDQRSQSGSSMDAYPTLLFSEDGMLRIFDGCRPLEGRFVARGAELTVSGMTPLADLSCTDPRVLYISAHYEKVFADGTLTYSMDAKELTITRGENGVKAFTD